MNRPTRINSAIPHPARVWNYLNGGRDNFEADRVAAGALLARAPGFAGVPGASSAFNRRVLRFLAAEAGVRQFIDIGAGLPAGEQTHELVQRRAPESRIVYVDNDPMVVSHARALRRSAPGGAVAGVIGDVRDPDQVLAEAGDTLDFGQPVAILLMNMLAFITGTGAARSIVAALTAGLPDGSYLGISHVASDLDPRLVAAAEIWNSRAGWPHGAAEHPAPVTLRSRAEVASLVQGLRLVAPGVVTAPEWRPDGRDADRREGTPDNGAAAAGARIPLYGLVARKPG
jgi:hypothetical protein